MSRSAPSSATGHGIRSFVAVDLDRAVLQALTSLQRDFAATGADVRWVRPEGMHITLKFLGSVEAPLLERVHAAVLEATDAETAITLQAHGLGAFPSLRRPRVVWAGLQDGGRLRRLAERLDETLQPLGFAREKRPFQPHVTLGRVNSQRGWVRLEAAIQAHIDDELGSSTVCDVVIYRSTLQRGGAVYTPLWTISLTENRGTA